MTTEFGPILLDIFVENLKPNSVCKALDLCDQTDGLNHFEMFNFRQNVEPFECRLCLVAVNIADTLLGQNVTEDNIVNFCSIILCSLLFQDPDMKDQVSFEIFFNESF